MGDTVIDLILCDNAGDSPYSPMNDFSEVSAIFLRLASLGGGPQAHVHVKGMVL